MTFLSISVHSAFSTRALLSLMQAQHGPTGLIPYLPSTPATPSVHILLADLSVQSLLPAGAAPTCCHRHKSNSFGNPKIFSDSTSARLHPSLPVGSSASPPQGQGSPLLRPASACASLGSPSPRLPGPRSIPNPQLVSLRPVSARSIRSKLIHQLFLQEQTSLMGSNRARHLWQRL